MALGFDNRKFLGDISPLDTIRVSGDGYKFNVVIGHILMDIKKNLKSRFRRSERSRLNLDRCLLICLAISETQARPFLLEG